MNKHFVAIALLILVAFVLIKLGVDIPVPPDSDVPAVRVVPENQGILRQ